jgi:hypothetical protein
MSLLAAFFLLQAAPQSAAQAEQPAPEGDILVIARKLKDWRGEWHLKKGRVTCKTKRSTGDTAIDAVGCAALVTCITPRAAELQALGDSMQDRAVKQQQITNMMRTLTPCIDASREQGIARLSEQRAGS